MLTDAALRNIKLKSKAYKVTDRVGLYSYVDADGQDGLLTSSRDSEICN